MGRSVLATHSYSPRHTHPSHPSLHHTVPTYYACPSQILRRLILHGFPSDVRSLAPVAAVSSCCPHMVTALQVGIAVPRKTQVQVGVTTRRSLGYEEGGPAHGHRAAGETDVSIGQPGGR